MGRTVYSVVVALASAFGAYAQMPGGSTTGTTEARVLARLNDRLWAKGLDYGTTEASRRYPLNNVEIGPSAARVMVSTGRMSTKI
jgi:hypothetical protein